MKYIAFTKDIAFEGVNNYCHKEYDWSVAKDNPIGRQSHRTSHGVL